MAFEDILLNVDSTAAEGGRIRAAAELARRHDAHLIGLHVTAIPRLPGYVEVEIPKRLLDAQVEIYAERERALREAFGEATERAGVNAEWRSVEGDPVEAITQHARYVDVVAVVQPSAAGRTYGIADDVVLAAGRPVLVLPRERAPEEFGRRVLIAWNARREAVRAVHDALPILQAAETVYVIAVNPRTANDEHGEIPAADICRHLARHDVRAEAQEVHSDHGAVGETLLAWAAEEGADTIVMGAWGHSRFRELVLGGATAHVLHHATVPLLMSH